MSKHYNSSKGPSQRQLRVGEQLRQIIAQTLQRGHFSDPLLLDLGGKVTVTEVRPSPDLKKATAYVYSLDGREMDEILPALNKESSSFQKEIGQQMNTKFTPRVHFVIDQSFEESSKIENILSKLSHSSDNDEE